ncbi:hypothetical protein J2Y48_003143 [Mycoplana sp. BE70]|uniref:hypothetical protein n=1 Tax=Mycoplana sp. BE70 TaxID=2817775 RepID=UPI002857826D|nr:hypothetical protein [Mycoplana sp. BE70]MDR6757846.1 hypothetical protein [Mycoplana sp. BE70]
MPGLETLALIVSSIATTTLAANALYLGTYALAIGGLAFGSKLLARKPDVPKPEDGSFNLKQNVPSLSYVLGRTKKGGDYLFLEEKGGTADHIICMAAHRIEGFVQHYAHDEKLTLDGNNDVTSPGHFTYDGTKYLRILTRLGANASTAYADIVSAFPTIWGNDHRGDGLATVLMRVKSASQKRFMKVFPNNMPEYSGVIDGLRLYDPRTGATAFSRNLALMRLWHLTSPVGGKLTRSDMYLPEWQNAANVCDQNVTNRSGATEKRYHGGFWFRAENDPVEVGRVMDQAAELVVYERADGLVGVHAGEFVAPDIRLTAADIISVQLDGNTRQVGTVLAVRGRYVDTSKDYNTADAAIYGNPYLPEEDTERTKTVDNEAVQSHNHVSRMQKIAFLRANAPRVSVVAHYEPAENVPYRRFVKVHVPPKLDEAIIEITDVPTISLRNLTVAFSGIIVPAGLYDFNAGMEEGKPGTSVEPLPPEGVPVPTGFDVIIKSETLSGGQKAAYALASWTTTNPEFTYELEWEPVSGGEPARSTLSEAGSANVRSAYLSDGVQYKFRLRTWAASSSDWTTYINRTATV